MKSVLCLVGIFCATIALADDPPSIYHTDWIDLNKNGTKDIYEDSTQPVEKRVEDLLGQMTLEEKIGQLHQSIHDVDAVKIYRNRLQRGGIGSFFGGGEMIESPFQRNALQRIAIEQSRLGIPLIFGHDSIHGFRTIFPIPLGQACAWEPELFERTQTVSARETSAGGNDWAFAPMVDLGRDPRWGRIAEGFGEDPWLGSVYAAANVRGFQGTNVAAPDRVVACVKHYVGYGAAEGGRDYNTTEISEYTLRNFYLPQLKAGVDAGVLTFMSAFNCLSGTPASGNRHTLKQILRKEWGFRGLVVSDWNSVGELIPHGIANDGPTAARKAFLAGVDMDMVSSLYHDNLQQIVKSGQATQAELDEAVRHVLRVKLALGLFEHPYVDESAAAKALYHPESIALAQTAAERSFVLLKNGNGPGGKPLLPLASGSQNIAVIGPLGDDSSYPGGAPPGAGPRVSLPAALARRVGDSHVSRFKGVGILDGTDDEIAAAVAGAQKADVVILTLGEAPEMSGEAASRAHLGLPGRQKELLNAIVKTGKPVVLILFSGRPLTLPWAFEHVPAVIAAWLPGMAGGPALTRTLFGDVNPSGKLVVSWPRAVGQEPLYYNHLNTGRPAGNTDLTRPPYDVASRYVSRYIDEQNAPQFPFGYGGSYTNFTYGATTISTQRLSASTLNHGLSLGGNAKAVITAEAEVTNTGSRPGDEVVQLYIQLVGTSVAEPVRMLKGFQTVSIASGETKKVRFELKPEAFAIWNDRNQFAVEPAKLNVWISPDSAHGSPAQADIVP